MPAFWVVEHLDVIEHIAASILPCVVDFSLNPFPLQKLEKALGYGVVMTVTSSAHTGLQVVAGQEPLPFVACKLAALV